MGSNLVVEPFVHGEECVSEYWAGDGFGGRDEQFYGGVRDTELNGLRGSEVGGKVDRWIRVARWEDGQIGDYAGWWCRHIRKLVGRRLVSGRVQI